MWLPVTVSCSQIMILAGSAPLSCCFWAFSYSADLYSCVGGAEVAQAARAEKAAAAAKLLKLGFICLPAWWNRPFYPGGKGGPAAGAGNGPSLHQAQMRAPARAGRIVLRAVRRRRRRGRGGRFALLPGGVGGGRGVGLVDDLAEQRAGRGRRLDAVFGGGVGAVAGRWRHRLLDQLLRHVVRVHPEFLGGVAGDGEERRPGHRHR